MTCTHHVVCPSQSSKTSTCDTKDKGRGVSRQVVRHAFRTARQRPRRRAAKRAGHPPQRHPFIPKLNIQGQLAPQIAPVAHSHPTVCWCKHGTHALSGRLGAVTYNGAKLMAASSRCCAQRQTHRYDDNKLPSTTSYKYTARTTAAPPRALLYNACDMFGCYSHRQRINPCFFSSHKTLPATALPRTARPSVQSTTADRSTGCTAGTAPDSPPNRPQHTCNSDSAGWPTCAPASCAHP